MSQPDERQYFIVKHDLESFQFRPGFIWRTNILPPKMPRGFRLVKKGDLWIEFAYINNETDRERCSLVTGFFRCVREADFRRVPKELALSDFEWAKKGYNWEIGGVRFEKQPNYPVAVPPINELLGRTVAGQNTITRISPEEFEHVRNETFRLELPPQKIPLLARAPRCEQELLSIVIAGRDRLGITDVWQVHVHFPDMLVEIDGEEVWIEIEVNSLDFKTHGHIRQLRRELGSASKFEKEAMRKDKDDNRPVAILCWVDNDKQHELKNRVRGLRIFELQSLLRTGEKIRF